MEIWKSIPSYPEYEVSTLGQVRSNRFEKTKLLSVGHTPTGYAQVRIGVQGKGKNLYIHRLVAEAFLPNPENLCEIDHIDRNRANNVVSNLRWATRQDNLLNTEAHDAPLYAIHRYRDGFKVKFKRDQKTINLPFCYTLEEAIQRRDDWLKNTLGDTQR
jgi:hypothetical protein